MSAKQLAEIEKKSPQIRAHSGEIWRDFIIRDFNDRPVPGSNFRKRYVAYYKDRQQHLENSSQRLRQKMLELEKEKSSRTITSLEVDPRAARSEARRKASSHAPSGSRIIQRAIQVAKSRGPIFSNKNTQFLNNNIKAPRFKVPAKIKLDPVPTISSPKKLGLSDIISDKKLPVHEPARIKENIVITDKGGHDDLDAVLLGANSSSPKSTSAIKKRKQPSVFLQPKKMRTT